MPIQTKCPVYATSRLTFFGLDMGTMLGMGMIVMFTKWKVGMYLSFVMAVTFAVVMKKMTKGQMPGIFLQKISVLAGHPSVKKYAPFLGKAIGQNWLNRGSIVAASVQQRYDP